MCELLGMSANVPTDICFSFSGLLLRGGKTGPHSDGWGIVFYEGKGFRTFKDPAPSCDSSIAEWVQNYPIKSCSVISHIRKANRGEVSLVNTHPFTREIWGRYWSYAHNGQLSDYAHLNTGHFKPVGETDSEKVFCWLLHEIEQHYPDQPDDMKEIFQFIASRCDTLRHKGIFNMLFSDGEYVMAYCSNHLYWITRKAPFGKASLIDDDITVDFHKETQPSDLVTLIATAPLTHNEIWHKMQPGEYCVFHLGNAFITNCENLE